MSCPPVGVGQDALEDVLNANAGRDYTVIRGDSPASIARKFGITLDALIAANPQKPTRVVNGVRTFQTLNINEGLNLPKTGVSGVGVGNIFGDIVNAVSKVASTITGGSSAVADVSNQFVQEVSSGTNDIAGVVQKHFPQLSATDANLVAHAVHPHIVRHRRRHRLSVPPPPPQLVGVGFNFFKALEATSPWGQAALALKAARHHPHHRTIQEWYREAHPGRTAPPSFSTADYAEYHRAIGVGVGSPAGETVRAVGRVNPCLPGSAPIVCAAQRAMGFEPDGKWGRGSYIAALQYDPDAPPPCSPRPAWWPPAGQGACAPTVNEVLVETKKALAELEAWKRAREGSGTMSGIRLNGRPIAGLGLGQDPAPQGTPTAAPPVVDQTQSPITFGGQTLEQAKARDAASHTWSGWWHGLSTVKKVGVAAVPVAVVGTGIFLATRKKGRGKRRSRR